MTREETLNKYEKNEITIIYDYNKSKDINIEDKERIKKELGETISREKLFGERFVKNNKNKCKMIINGKKEEISSYLMNYHVYLNKGKLEIKLIDIKNISDISYMFSGCLSLISLPDISKMKFNNITNIRGIFFYCSSLSYIDDIGEWEIKNIQDICGIFQYCSSLRSLPDISKWTTTNVTNMDCIFQECSSLSKLPDISKWNTENITNMNGIF